ncbi:helicase [Humibacillus sp. DSM 29435]|uniref:DEAD/DEAH box helicase n=1 Tax=Humibacillus sp. DSM 29435 TaxID=1869167 RepID=UPI0008730287|nr:DEAD/DEAH box helicase [Humibacillus sp. DSM 29435]OFE15367.1 helicase [Humibacillus sp. DSM 29435]
MSPNVRRRTSGRPGGRVVLTRPDDPAPIIPILARRVREIEAKVGRGPMSPSNRTKFQVIALLVRSERARIKGDPEIPSGARTELLKRLDGIATILAQVTSRDTSLLTLLDGKTPGPAAQRLRLDWLLESGAELAPEDMVIVAPAPPAPVIPAGVTTTQAPVPASVSSRVMSNPFLAPDLGRALQHERLPGRLAGWDLMDPLYRAFEEGAGGGSATMDLPPAPTIDRISPQGSTLMVHQARFLEEVRLGHRTFLLADEPGLGKTAQSVLAASVAGAYPMLAVVPNVVKINWAREVQRWTPQRRVAVIHGDGRDVDAFADVFVVNYEILDRHFAWLSSLGLRSMVVDEAHFIKNLKSQRSQQVLALADRLRDLTPGGNPLLMALTGTPLINDVKDFQAIWTFLGWVRNNKPTSELIGRLEETGLTPSDRAFYREARSAVVDMGIVRRRKVDVAKDLPEKRVADIPVELDDDLGRSVRQAERALGQRLLVKYRAFLTEHNAAEIPGEPDEALMRRVAAAELKSSSAKNGTENVFSLVRRIGQAKASLASDYAIQLSHSVGKVVFFAKHIDVMDTAERKLADAGLRTVSVRGEQTSKQRQVAIDAFQNDPEVAVAVCSLTAAGVGLNLHAASNVVLAELSWTAAEQGQAIDRVHRIGQDEPVTAWRILAAGTIDSKIAELIDAKQGLAARALDGSDEEVASGDTLQLEALVQLLRQALAD